MFIGRDRIAFAQIKFRQTAHQSQACDPDFRCFRRVASDRWPQRRRVRAAPSRNAIAESWSAGPAGSPCEASPAAVRAFARPRSPISAGRRRSAGHRSALRSSARPRPPYRRRAPRCSGRGRSAVSRCPTDEVQDTGIRECTSARAGPLAIRDGAVMSGGQWPSTERMPDRDFCSPIHTSFDAPALKRIGSALPAR